MPYFVVEGQDATGKTTQVEMLAEYYRAQGHDVVVVEEPSQHSLPARTLRRLLKGKRFGLTAKVQVLLFTASRLLLWSDVIEPALERGAIVVASRNWYSTLAYQCGDDGLTMRQIESLTREWMPMKYMHPHGAVILVATETERLKRQAQRDDKSSQDAFESRDEEYQERVNQNYWEIARGHGVPIVKVTTMEETQQKIREALGV